MPQALVETQNGKDAGNSDSEVASQPPEKGNAGENASPGERYKARLAQMRKSKLAKCRSCERAYEHDGQRWCSTKRCPSRLPASLRPAYRPDPSRPEPGKPEPGKPKNHIAKTAPEPLAAKAERGMARAKLPQTHEVVETCSLVSCTRLKIFGVTVYEREVTARGG